MGLLRLAGFSGMWPIRDARALPDNAALYALNVDSDGGAYLKGKRPVNPLKTLYSTTQSVFRLPSVLNLASSYWMQFVDPYTQVYRGPLVNDTFERYYWGSPTAGIRYAPRSTVDGFVGALDTGGYLVGVPAPATAPVITSVTGGSTPIVTRQYLVTFRNQYGEESAPSLPVEGDGNANGTWNIGSIPQPPAPGSYTTYGSIRLYRTVTGISGLTDFYLVANLGVGTTSYADSIPDTALEVQLESTSYDLPPTGLQGLVLMPNGIFVSWKDNNLYFSENYRPHAWPAEYVVTVDDPIVGLAAYGNSCVVCTTGKPSIVTGTKAGAMALQKTDAPLPCLSRSSIVAAPEGVYYASEEGLVLVAAGSINTVTNELISRDQWRTTFLPSKQASIVKNGEYISFFPPGGTIDGFKFWPREPAAKGVTYLDVDADATPVNIVLEKSTGTPCLIADYIGTRYLYEWDAQSTLKSDYVWKSREFIYPYPANFTVFQCFFDEAVSHNKLSLKIEVTLRGNDGTTEWRTVYDRPVLASGKEIKLPSGFKSDIWRFTFYGDAQLQCFMIASSARELRSA